MSRSPKRQIVRLGPAMPSTTYLRSAFSRLPKGIDIDEVWSLIQPTVQHNIDKPLWKQFCAIYIEGLNHGSRAGESDEIR